MWLMTKNIYWEFKSDFTFSFTNVEHSPPANTYYVVFAKSCNFIICVGFSHCVIVSNKNAMFIMKNYLLNSLLHYYNSQNTITVRIKELKVNLHKNKFQLLHFRWNLKNENLWWKNLWIYSESKTPKRIQNFFFSLFFLVDFHPLPDLIIAWLSENINIASNNTKYTLFSDTKFM